MRRRHPVKEILMKKAMLRDNSRANFHAFGDEVVSNIENFKRRRVLHPFGSLDLSSRLFFERALHVKRGSEFVFLTKSQGRNR